MFNKIELKTSFDMNKGDIKVMLSNKTVLVYCGESGEDSNYFICIDFDYFNNMNKKSIETLIDKYSEIDKDTINKIDLDIIDKTLSNSYNTKGEGLFKIEYNPENSNYIKSPFGSELQIDSTKLLKVTDKKGDVINDELDKNYDLSEQQDFYINLKYNFKKDNFNLEFYKLDKIDSYYKKYKHQRDPILSWIIPLFIATIFMFILILILNELTIINYILFLLIYATFELLIAGLKVLRKDMYTKKKVLEKVSDIPIHKFNI